MFSYFGLILRWRAFNFIQSNEFDDLQRTKILFIRHNPVITYEYVRFEIYNVNDLNLTTSAIRGVVDESIIKKYLFVSLFMLCLFVYTYFCLTYSKEYSLVSYINVCFIVLIYLKVGDYKKILI